MNHRKPNTNRIWQRLPILLGWALVMMLIVGQLLADLALAQTPTPAPATPVPSLESGETIPLDVLIAEAQKEGELTVIALPHDWANYGEIIATFKQKYGLKVNELNPEASSGEELEAVRANKYSRGPQAPDVLDIGLGFTAVGMAEGLFAPYKVATWDTIPENLKDPDGYWFANYYGVLVLESNLDVVTNPPKDWADLLKPEYKNMIALAGDPTASNEAVMSVLAAGLSRTQVITDPLAPDALDAAAWEGLNFFAELKKMGNLLPVIAGTGTIAKGETPITIQWDYLALANRDNFQGNPELAIYVPESAVLAGPYAYAISAYAPHPYAARLWFEFLYSDEGQLLLLKGYTHPIRFNDLAARNVIPAELLEKLPPAELYAKAVFPTREQLTSTRKIITENWRKMVLGE
jgi:putative spermidine/putrescine transport system substrate-binding protein